MSFFFFFSSRRRHTRCSRDWSSDVCSSDLDRDLVGQAESNPDLRIGPERPPKIRFKDLEALVVARIVRDQVKFSNRIEFAAATHATTLVRIEIKIPCDTCTQTAAEYPLFVRLSKPLGWVVATSELVAGVAMHDKSDSELALTTQPNGLLRRTN